MWFDDAGSIALRINGPANINWSSGYLNFILSEYYYS